MCVMEDLTTAIEWAGQAAVPGPPANEKVLEGLKSFLPSETPVAISNPTSSRDNAVSPALTRVLLCRTTAGAAAKTLCVKFYSDSKAGAANIHRHECLLRKLHGVVPVPEVIAAVPSGDRFGFPVLITTAIGDPLDEQVGCLSPSARAEIISDFAAAIATLHRSDPPPSLSRTTTIRTNYWLSGGKIQRGTRRMLTEYKMPPTLSSRLRAF